MNYDIIIIGGGPSGLSCALSLKNSGLKVLLIEKNSQESLANPQPDGREIALTQQSISLLKSMQCWDYLLENGISPIKHAKVVNGDSSYSLDFSNSSLDKDELGYIVPNYLIRTSIYKLVEPLENITFKCDTSVKHVSSNSSEALVTLDNDEVITSKLVIAADSRFSTSRRDMGIGTSMNDFARTAIVCRMSHSKSHDETAFECFHYGRTLAILPMDGNMSSVVITLPNTKVDEVMAQSAADFSQNVTDRLSGQLGDMQLEGERYTYPLVTVHAKQFVATRFALIGDAAVGMHPVTAHGFNLGLKGQQILTTNILNALKNKQDIGSDLLLKNYEKQHMRVTKPLYLGTNGIVTLFTNESSVGKLSRKVIMRLANNFPPLKTAIIHKLTETKSEWSNITDLLGLKQANSATTLSSLSLKNKFRDFPELPKLSTLPKLPKSPFSRR